MIKQDFDNLVNSSYSRKQLCWIILQCLDIVSELNKQEQFLNLSANDKKILDDFDENVVMLGNDGNVLPILRIPIEYNNIYRDGETITKTTIITKPKTDREVQFFEAKECEEIKTQCSKEDIIVTHTKEGYQKSDKAVHVLKEIAKASKVSHDTVAKVKYIEQKADYKQVYEKFGTGSLKFYGELKK